MEPITALRGSPGIGAAGSVARPISSSVSDAASFGKSLEDALKTVSKMQNESQALTREFQAENPAVSLEETMIGMQQASLSFQTAVQVRNKLVAAYSEMMNMQV
jgi:flagellar hook-basal body complex protein FliE